MWECGRGDTDRELVSGEFYKTISNESELHLLGLVLSKSKFDVRASGTLQVM